RKRIVPGHPEPAGPCRQAFVADRPLENAGPHPGRDRDTLALQRRHGRAAFAGHPRDLERPLRTPELEGGSAAERRAGLTMFRGEFMTSGQAIRALGYGAKGGTGSGLSSVAGGETKTESWPA